jgi:leucyl-tRNA synthetase
MVLTNEIRSALDAGQGAGEAAEALTLMLAPLAPFAAEELWRTVLGHGSTVHLEAWPSFDPELAAEDRVVLVVQVDGKVRDRIEVDATISEDEARELALASERVTHAVDGREVQRVIVRPPKLVNVVTAG